MQECCIGNLRCLVKKPKDFNENKKYPILLFLHGAGTRGNDINNLCDSLFFKLTDSHNLPFVIVAPLCEENTWFDVFERLKLLVKEVSNYTFTDKQSVYLMGTSMGGYATWQLAMSCPEYFAAIVPICGGGMYWNAQRLINIPIWAFHGGKDGTVLLEESIKMVNAVNQLGGSAKLTVYPENTHDAWSDTYSNPKVFEWLLQHKNKNCIEICDKYNDSNIYG